MAAKRTVEFRDGNFALDGEPVFLYSGEVHYFRIPKKHWRDRLRRLKSAGFNAVSSYVPWIWHEPEEGKFDFTGRTHPERDVAGFLDLAAREGLLALARIGPVSNAELLNEGIPAWLLRDHPEVFVTGTRDVGTLPHVTMLSYLHPLFQQKAGRWYENVLPIVGDRQVTRGGAVFGVQLCNEVAMVHWLQKGSDHKDHVNALYRAFLRDKFGDIKSLNRAHGTDYAGFDEIAQPSGEGAGPERWPLLLDWALFYRRYYATYFLTLSARARSNGIDVPLYCNIPQFYDYDVRGRGVYAPMTSSLFRDFPLLTPGLIFGGAYQLRHIDFENFHDFAQATEVIRLLNTVRPRGDAPLPAPAESLDRLPSLPEFDVPPETETPVVCAELQTGIMRDRPRIYPHQVALHVKSAVAHGLAGINAYMYAGGVNPPGLGAFGAYHDWQAPVGPDGDVRDHHAPLKEFGDFLKWSGPLLARTQKVTDTTLGSYLPYYATEYWSGPWVEKLEAHRTAYWYDGLARLVQLAGFNYQMVDLQRSSTEELLRHSSLWIYSLDAMDGETQKKLADYVRGGGKLILYPRLPVKNLKGERDTTLADALGLSVAGERPGNLLTIQAADHWVQGPVQLFRAVEGVHHPVVPVEKAAAVIRKQAGKGEVLAIGFGLPHVYDHFRDWVAEWAQEMGIRPRVSTAPWDVSATLRADGAFGFLFLFNYHFTARETTATLLPPGESRSRRLPGKGRLHLEPFTAAILPLNVPLSGNRKIIYSTAEVRGLRQSAGGVELMLATTPGHRYEAAFSLPKPPRAVRVNGRRVSYRKGGECLLDIAAERSYTKVSIQ